MHPVLCTIGRVTLYTYGLFIALGFFFGLVLARFEAVRRGQDPDRLIDLGFWVLISAVVGARLFYVGTMPEAFMAHPLDILKIWQGGLVFYGGFIGAGLATIAFCRIHQLRLRQMADILVPSVALGQAIGRIGCFFAGCCYGKPTDLPWAITFAQPDSLAPLHIPLHPTQLYSSAANGLIFLFLWFRRKRARFEGELFWWYILLYGVARSSIELFRGDFRGEPVLGVLSPAQAIGLTMASVAAVVLVVRARHRATGS